MSKLEDLKRLAARRTKHNWEDVSSQGYVPGITQLTAHTFILGTDDYKFVAACANNIDKLLAVVEAAKLAGEEMRLRPFSPDSAPFDILSEKLAALEEG